MPCTRLVLSLLVSLTLTPAATPLLAQAVAPTSAVPTTAPVEDAAMAERVKQQYLHAWNSYKQDAWGHDELNPSAASLTTGTASRST